MQRVRVATSLRRVALVILVARSLAEEKGLTCPPPRASHRYSRSEMVVASCTATKRRPLDLTTRPISLSAPGKSMKCSRLWLDTITSKLRSAIGSLGASAWTKFGLFCVLVFADDGQRLDGVAQEMALRIAATPDYTTEGHFVPINFGKQTEHQPQVESQQAGSREQPTGRGTRRRPRRQRHASGLPAMCPLLSEEKTPAEVFHAIDPRFAARPAARVLAPPAARGDLAREALRVWLGTHR